jgi:Zn-dependent protease with chaperone function
LHRAAAVSRRALVLLFLSLSACSSLPEPAPRWQAWSATQGGVVGADEPAQLRAEVALARLRRSGAQGGVAVRVLASSSIAAFAWHDGSIFVTRGLVERLDADLLCAALAHELAHLTGRGDGLAAGAEEMLADRLGSELLRASGLDPELMLHMLARVGHALGEDHPARFEARIFALREGLRSASSRADGFAAAR